MHEYEIFIEEINPCGGEQYSKKTLIEAEAVSPEAYVKENGRFPGNKERILLNMKLETLSANQLQVSVK